VLVGLALASPVVRAEDDLRSREILWLDCASEIGSRDVTLFSNGTLRVRSRGPEEEVEMWLGELTPDETQAYVNRLAEIDLREAESARSGVVGEWLEQCEVRLARPGEAERRFRFGRYDSLGLALSRVVRIAEELEREAMARDARHGLPVRYQPRPGDVLIDAEGMRFEVLRFTADGGGVELAATDWPLILYLGVEQLRERFVALERGDGRELPR
jgi:hypothetical protein